MRLRVWIWLLACLLCVGGAWLMWRPPWNPRTKLSVSSPAAARVLSASAATNNLAGVSANSTGAIKTNQFPWRLSNTSKSLGQLTSDRHAILLANAFIDTSEPLKLSIPAHLRSPGDPGAYIIQARGPIDAAFRAMLAAAGAEIVAYIPNDAYLVRAEAGVANGLAANPLTQAVIPYEPYYKIQMSLLGLAVQQKPLLETPVADSGLFPDTAQQTIKQIEQLGWPIIARDNRRSARSCGWFRRRIGRRWPPCRACKLSSRSASACMPTTSVA